MPPWRHGFPSLPGPPYVGRAELGGRPRTVVYIAHPSSWGGGPKTIRELYGPQTLAQLRAIAQGSDSAMPAPTILPPIRAAGTSGYTPAASDARHRPPGSR